MDATTIITMKNDEKLATTKSQDFWDSITDERVNEYYLLRGGPSIVVSIVLVYLYFVLYLGPRLMQAKQRFALNRLLFVYNLCMSFVNLWLLIQGLLVSNFGIDTWGCDKFGGDIRQSPRRGIYLGYLFFLTKLVELLDTVFFVLRKKKEQITFLHVFHHAFVPLIVWLSIKLAPGGPNGFFPLINSFIHVFMYTYYALSTLGDSVKKHLWWKRHLTRMQMIQFLLVMINSTKTSMSKDCKFPRMFTYLQALIAATFLVLFAGFYSSAYSGKNNKQTTNAMNAGCQDADDGDRQRKQQQAANLTRLNNKLHTINEDSFQLQHRRSTDNCSATTTISNGKAKVKLV